LRKKHLLILIPLLFLFASCGGASDAPEDIEDLSSIPVVETAGSDISEDESEQTAAITNHHIPNYIINLDIDPKDRRVNGVMQISFKNTSSHPLDRVFLNVPFNAFSEEAVHPPFFYVFENRVFQHGHDFAVMDIQAATINLNPALFQVDNTLLTIYFDDYLPIGSAAEIGIVFEAVIPRISHRTGGNDYAMWFGNFLPTLAVLSDDNWHIYPFFPAGSPFFTVSSNYQVNITTPLDYRIIATGQEIRNEVSAMQLAVTSVDIGLSRDFAFAALSDAYNSYRATGMGGISVGLYFHSRWENIDAAAILETAVAAFDYFSERIGTFPHQNFDIVETELFIHDSIKLPGIMFIDSRQLRSNAVHASIARDIGYQWFYNVLGNNPVTEAWLSHGLVAFLQLGFSMQEEDMHNHMQNLHASLSSRLLNLNYPLLSYDLSVYATWNEFHSVQVQRGKMLFYALWQRMGPEKFDEFLQTYYQRYIFSIASSDGMIAVAEEVYGESLEEFFNAWINSPALPDIDNVN